MNSVPLHFQKMGESGPEIMIVHGLYGMGRNWLSMAKKLADWCQVYLIDLRNHGESPWHDEWDLDVMSQDLQQFRLAHQIQHPILLGHSLGGKVSMVFAGRYYPTPLKALIVVDVAPKAYDPGYHQHLVQSLLKLELSGLKSRAEALELLEKDIPDKAVRRFLLTNLESYPEGGYQWRMNLPVIAQKLEGALGSVERVFHEPFEFDEAPVLFVRGENSEYISEDDEPLIRSYFPEAEFCAIAGAGHWVHAEQPNAFYDKVSAFIRQLS